MRSRDAIGGLFFCALLVAAQAAGNAIDDGMPGNAREGRGLVCVALAVFSEARGEPRMGQALVASVVLRRLHAAQSRGLDVDACDIVHADDQFHGVRDWPFPRHPERIDARAWRAAVDVSREVMGGEFEMSDPDCASVDHFWRSDTPLPSWARGMRRTCVVGAHTFAFTPPADVAAK